MAVAQSLNNRCCSKMKNKNLEPTGQILRDKNLFLSMGPYISYVRGRIDAMPSSKLTLRLLLKIQCDVTPLSISRANFVNLVYTCDEASNPIYGSLHTFGQLMMDRTSGLWPYVRCDYERTTITVFDTKSLYFTVQYERYNITNFISLLIRRH